jgi:hypothetical protein
MSFVRTFFKVIFAVLLAVSLILFIINLSFVQTTSYENLQPRISIFTEQTISSSLDQSTPEDLSLLKAALIENCSGQQETIFSFGEQEFMPLNEIVIDCTEISNETTTEQLINLVSSSVFNTVYDKKYDCSVPDCLKNIDKDSSNLLVLVSRTANRYFTSIMIILLVLIVAIVVALVLFSKPKQTAMYALAPAFIVSGLLFLLKFPLSAMASNIQEPAKSILDLWISSLFINSLVSLCLGIVFLILSIILIIAIKKSKKINGKE